MHHNSNRNQGRTRGDHDSWHIPTSFPPPVPSGQQAALSDSLHHRFGRLSIARYQHDAGHDLLSPAVADAHAHPAHHHSERDGVDAGNPGYSPGAALAARITLPASFKAGRYSANGNMQTPASSQRTRHNGHGKHNNNCKYCSNGRGYANRPPLSATDPLPGFRDSFEMSSEQYAGSYKPAVILRSAASEYMNGQFKDVFEWWYHRILDRLDRKMDSGIELDFHEKVINQLHEWSTGSTANADQALNPILNYYAEQMIPKRGFLVSHVETARNNPLRWERRDQREKGMWEKDPSGGMIDEHHAKGREKATNRWKSWEEHVKHCLRSPG